MVTLDYLYCANWSLWLDAKILARTIPYVLSRAQRRAHRQPALGTGRGDRPAPQVECRAAQRQREAMPPDFRQPS